MKFLIVEAILRFTTSSASCLLLSAVVIQGTWDFFTSTVNKVDRESLSGVLVSLLS